MASLQIRLMFHFILQEACCQRFRNTFVQMQICQILIDKYSNIKRDIVPESFSDYKMTKCLGNGRQLLNIVPLNFNKTHKHCCNKIWIKVTYTSLYNPFFPLCIKQDVTLSKVCGKSNFGGRDENKLMWVWHHWWCHDTHQHIPLKCIAQNYNWKDSSCLLYKM